MSASFYFSYMLSLLQFLLLCFLLPLTMKKYLFSKLLGDTTTPNHHLMSFTLLRVKLLSDEVALHQPYSTSMPQISLSPLGLSPFFILTNCFSANTCNIYKPSVPDCFPLIFCGIVNVFHPNITPCCFSHYLTA